MAEPSCIADYGTTRSRRPSVSYAQFERTADELLAAGGKPGLENVRKAIGGSPETIRQMLRRYWIDLAAQKRSPAEALKRLPSEIADLADELWQRSLALSAQTATHDDSAARERLEQVKRENELRSHALAVKERTLREREDSRERTMTELQEQVATLLAIISRNTETITALQAEKANAQARAENYRRQLAKLIAQTVIRNRTLAAGKRRTLVRVKPKTKSKRTAPLRKPAPTSRRRRARR